MARGTFAAMARWSVLPTLLLFVLGPWTEAQAFYIQLHGQVTDYFSGDGLKDMQVRLVKDSIDRETVVTGRNGEYELILERGYEYLVWFSGQGRVTKHVRIDTREVPPIPDVPFYDMDLQMTMFLWIDGVDFSILEKPVAEAHYRHSIRNLTWDTEHTERVRRELSRVMAHYEHAFHKHKGVTGTSSGSGTSRRKRKRVDF